MAYLKENYYLTKANHRLKGFIQINEYQLRKFKQYRILQLRKPITQNNIIIIQKQKR